MFQLSQGQTPIIFRAQQSSRLGTERLGEIVFNTE
jgi:hypothetical protein